MENNKEFGKIRSIIFPIYTSELRKFIPLTSIFFIISFNYSILRSLKDMFILQNTGAEVIYYLKVFGVMPSIILLTILYSKISKGVSRDTRFNIVIAYFLVFFGITYFFLIPNLESLRLDNLADSLEQSMPRLLGLWDAIRYWPLSLLYINAEAWGTLALSVLFWTFVNEITPIYQAKRFYSFLSIGASIGLIIAGTMITTFKNNFNALLGFVVVFVAVLLVIYNIFAQDIRKNPTIYQVEQKPKKKKVKTTFWESIQFLAKSRYLALISILVLSYNMFISLFEAIWKAEIKELLNITGDQSISAVIYGAQGIYGGIATIILTVFFSAPIMNRGWRFAASFTPVVALVCTIVFFSFLYFQDSLGAVTTMLNTTPIMMAVMFGLANVVFIKSAKYILFDPTKERAYIPLDEESKVRGKAAVDGVGSRLGKSLGSFLLTMFLVPLFGDNLIVNVRYHVFFILIVILVGWLVAINKLSVRYNKLTEEQEKQEKEVL
ncbi:ADP/ATP carrier protein [Candidatus Amoebophilus asiaticus 5a2]|uniref:ADP,ATP carrier protein n=1 Tax=Amoebophilus asiaticus (strain 5a2) TaxID=452471 RepID=B3EUA0_AMOA5|nr:Npt1/Npt2 family nucleotide transporter [Candidatus Amoebophilus asiaticus]ACE05519.1 ADP/ATP carrier protein [Candidatus Amoebophilus asiaticus 5a2]